MITRINYFEAKAGSADTLQQLLHAVTVTIQNSVGCVSCRLLRGVDNPAHLTIIEEWESVEAHQEAARRIPPDKLAEVMALLATPPSGSSYA
jgi:quinol monooxygenase YgiN